MIDKQNIDKICTECDVYYYYESTSINNSLLLNSWLMT